MTLRASQIETLKVGAALFDNWTDAFEGADLAWKAGISTSAAKARLDRLAVLGYLSADRSNGRVYFALTNQGRTALEEADG